MMDKKIKVGILIDDFITPAWVYRMIEEINQSDYAEISLVVKNQTEASRPHFFARLRRGYNKILYYLYIQLDKKIFKVSQDAFRPMDIRPLIKAHVLTINPIRGRFSDKFAKEDIGLIKDHEVDVLLRLGFRILRGEILEAAKYGIWSFHHGDGSVNRGGPAGVWEVMQNWDETGVILQILTETLDGGRVIDKSFSCTDKFSIARNKSNYYWKALSLIPRNLKQLYEIGGFDFMKKVLDNNRHPSFYYNRLFTTPTNLEMIVLVIRKWSRIIANRFISWFYFEQWILMFRLNSEKDALSNSFYQFRKILPPKDRFWADPHVVEHLGKYYIFIEDFVYRTNKGHISVIIMDEKGVCSEPQKVLECDYHLSYPFVFNEGQQWYMIPETCSNNGIELYRCVEFPFKWEYSRTLMENVQAVDATIFKKNGRFWMFANIKENPGASTWDELFLFSSKELIHSEWEPHPQNPIVSDVKKARPAGRIFENNGQLYRPSQNCSKRYGYGLQISHINELSPDKYSEELIQSIYPNWADNILGTHSLTSAGKLTIIDAQIHRWRY